MRGEAVLCPFVVALGPDRDIARQTIDEQLGTLCFESPGSRRLAKARLIRELVDARRLLDGTLLLDVQMQPVMPLFEEALESIREAANVKGITVERAIAVPDPNAAVDAQFLTRALSRIIENSVAFTDRGGRICVRVNQRKGSLRIDIMDTGRGPPGADLATMFHPTFQGGTLNGRPGLGLTVARGIIELHGGHINGRSGAPTFGAIITVLLPGAHADSKARGHGR